MKSKTRWTLLTILSLAIAACSGGGERTEESTKQSEPKKEAATASTDAPAPHTHGTVEHDLGVQEIGGVKVQAYQMDDAMAGGETVFKLKFTGAEPSAARLWVGDESASNTTRVLSEKDSEAGFHAHAEIPNPVGTSDRFWVEYDLDGKPVKASFPLATGAVLPGMGPHTGFVAALNGVPGFAELKLHDDKGDLELWLAQDAAITQPLDLPIDAAITVTFPDLSKSAELRVRNAEKNEDEDGKANIRDGKTNYFIFPGASGANPSWLMGNFRSTATIQFTSEGNAISVAPFTLVPHTHGPGGHTH